MAKMMIECTDPNDLEAVQKATEQFVGRCNVTYYKQAQAMIEVGSASGEREAARKIAEKTGESDESVRCRIKRGKQVGQRDPPRQRDVTEAMQFAVIAISQLGRIRKDDPQREAAFKRVVDWINKNKWRD